MDTWSVRRRRRWWRHLMYTTQNTSTFHMRVASTHSHGSHTSGWMCLCVHFQVCKCKHIPISNRNSHNVCMRRTKQQFVLRKSVSFVFHFCFFFSCSSVRCAVLDTVNDRRILIVENSVDLAHHRPTNCCHWNFHEDFVRIRYSPWTLTSFVLYKVHPIHVADHH